MNIQFSFLGAVLFVLIACGSVFGQAQAKRQIEWRVAARRKSHKRLPKQLDGADSLQSRLIMALYFLSSRNQQG
jgi:hypothetical protein